MLTFRTRKFISKRIPPSEKKEKEREKSPSHKSSSDKPASSGGMTGPRLAALYQQLKQAEGGKNGESSKAKGSASAVTNGGSSHGKTSR
jgi:hypothetical protein